MPLLKNRLQAGLAPTGRGDEGQMVLRVVWELITLGCPIRLLLSGILCSFQSHAP